jgi:queuosine precursor transporter
MIRSPLDDRAVRLYIALAAFFCVNTVLAQFIGVKIFALEDTLGLPRFEWSLFGQSGSLDFTAGTLVWPFVFVFTDIINEFFGRRGVRMISYVAVALILYGFVFAFVAIQLAPAQWWVGAAQNQGIDDYQQAYAAVFGQGLWAVAGSVTAFIIGQLIDVRVFQRIRNATGERYVWLRATGSTAVSQFIDSYIVLYIMFVLGPQQWPLSQLFAVGSVNYAYKMAAAIALIPLIYLMRRGIAAYLGVDRARELRELAAHPPGQAS